MKNFTSGHYTQQYQYKSFSPTLIATFNFEWKSNKTIQMLTEATRFLGELNASSEFVPNVDFFLAMHITKEATTSSRIEGTKTNFQDALQPIQNIATEKRDDWQEVKNYIQAMNHSIDTLNRLPLSLRLVKQAHSILLSGVRGENKSPGEVRKSQNWIGGASLRTAAYIPPAHQELPDLLSDLENFWHRQDVPDLIRIAIAHYQFETIHPFLDGNGRTGRMIITLHLVALGILKRPTLYLSEFLEQHRQEYFDALITARENNDLEFWVNFFLEGIIQTSKKGRATFESIVKLRQKYEETIAQFGKRAPVYQKVIYQLFKHPVISPREVESLLEVTPRTANKMLRNLENIGLLKEQTFGKRNRSYALQEYIDIFQ